MADIRVERLRKVFGPVVALDDVDFSFPDSSVTCLLGPSGCGKTTLMRIIAGLEVATAGEVFFGERNVTGLPPRKREIGMVFQYPVVYKGINVRENIELPLKSEKLSAAERRRRVDEVIEVLGLAAAADKDVGRLDNGTRQKVAVARAVARQPQIILFDEPITNVDAHAKLQLKRAFKELTKQLRQTIVYVTHDQTEAMTLADQIALMRDGKIVQCDAPRELYNHPADRFGGWFLGNPGMNFFETTIQPTPDGRSLVSPLIPEPLPVQGPASSESVVIGIRPERIAVSTTPGAGAVAVKVARKSITIGRQYLLALEIDGLVFKAKVPASLGREIGDRAWVRLPIEEIVLFGPDGTRAELVPTAVAARV